MLPSRIELSPKSIDYLNRRELNQNEISDFQDLLNKAQRESTQLQHSSKEILSQMSKDELSLLQKANSLVDHIKVSDLSEEGATNLLRQPDNSDRVDLNNDGIVEVGIAKNMVFPPVNAPDHVKSAWDKATEGMNESDVMHLQLTMHLAVFCIQIDGQNKAENVSPQQQWSSSGIDFLFSELRAGLDFRVQREGWTEHNSMLNSFYNRFEQALSGQAPQAAALTTTKNTTSTAESSTEPSSASSKSSTQTPLTEQEKSQRLLDLMQSVIDARIGLDREKLKEIEARMKEVAANDKLDDKQKKQFIEQLEKLKEAFFDTLEKKLVDDEKRKSLSNAPSTLLGSLTEDLLKAEIEKKTALSL